MTLAIWFSVWSTPNSQFATPDEARALVGTPHPALGVLGVLLPKNPTVNLMTLTSFLSYVLYRRANKLPIKSWVLTGMAIQWAAFFVAAAIVVFYGVYR